MAVPKRKTSKAKRDQRRASNFKLEQPNLTECPQCHELKPSHIVCKKCGYYDGKQVIDMEEKKSKA
ncbi:MAG: 50S ribosomal protein L32 [Clostridiales bacterium]|nr:50S ribosomal protein L32 [Clostridiales bacterium]